MARIGELDQQVSKLHDIVVLRQWLDSTDRDPGIEGKRLLIKILSTTIEDHGEDFSHLLHMTADKLKAVANTAASQIVELVGRGLAIRAEDLRIMAQSRHGGVKQYWMRAIEQLASRPDGLSVADLLEVARDISQSGMETAVKISGMTVLRDWIRQQRTVDLPLLEAIDALLRTDLQNKEIYAGHINLIKSIGERSLGRLPALLSRWAKGVLCSVDLGRISDGEHQFSDFLTAAARTDPSLLNELFDALSSLPVRNLKAFVLATHRVEGKASELLSKVLASAWCPDDLRAFILSVHGV